MVGDAELVTTVANRNEEAQRGETELERKIRSRGQTEGQRKRREEEEREKKAEEKKYIVSSYPIFEATVRLLLVVIAHSSEKSVKFPRMVGALLKLPVRVRRGTVRYVEV